MMDKTQSEEEQRSPDASFITAVRIRNWNVWALAARKFVDFLKKLRDRDTGRCCPSAPPATEIRPYQSFSAYAGNPYFIDLEML